MNEIKNNGDENVKENVFMDLIGEIRSFVKGNTLDALIPSGLFIVLNNFFSLIVATLLPLILALVIFLIRIYKKQKWQYAIGGFIGVVIASSFALIAGNAKDYFLPDIISGIFFLVLCLVSIFIKKPLAAWVSHLTRGWKKEWFWRKDVFPAYQEVTIFWGVFLTIRLIILVLVYLNSDTLILFLSNVILGFPSTLLVLTISYIYGIWRLKSLQGPGIDEFINNTPKPWRGQKKGF